MIDEKNKHTKNGLYQQTVCTQNGFLISINVSTGICGESSSITFYDSNLYPDEDSRNDRQKEYTIPLNNISDLEKLAKSIDGILKQRKLTLIKK